MCCTNLEIMILIIHFECHQLQHFFGIALSASKIFTYIINNCFIHQMIFAGPVLGQNGDLTISQIGLCGYLCIYLCGSMMIGWYGPVWLYFWSSHWSESVGGHQTSTVAVSRFLPNELISCQKNTIPINRRNLWSLRYVSCHKNISFRELFCHKYCKSIVF